MELTEDAVDVLDSKIDSLFKDSNLFIIVGNEKFGVSSVLLQASTMKIRIPTRSSSINVSAATAIAGFRLKQVSHTN